MRTTRWSLAALALIAAGYVAYPYATLYRIGHAIHTGNAKALQTLVDWPSVRAGIKEDICDSLDDSPGPTAGNALPAFGASFVHGVAVNAVDRHVTPQGLVAAAQHGSAHSGSSAVTVHVARAFFTTPTHFEVSLRAGSRAHRIRLEMTLQRGEWRVTRVWLPHDMLEQANART